MGARLDGWTAGELLERPQASLRDPDYPGYLQHMAERHPDSDVLSERQFFEAHLQARYGSGVTRCC